jgi:hypothetical protein
MKGSKCDHPDRYAPCGCVAAFRLACFVLLDSGGVTLQTFDVHNAMSADKGTTWA